MHRLTACSLHAVTQRQSRRRDSRTIADFAALTDRVRSTGNRPQGFRDVAEQAVRATTSRARRDKQALARLERMTTRFNATGKQAPGYAQSVLHAFTVLSERDIAGLTSSPPTRDTVVREFEKLFHHDPSRTWQNTRFLGAQILKNPLDMWVYQEILHELRPDVIVEAGTWRGGSASFLARMCDLVGHGRVVTIDIALPDGTTEEMLPRHPRLTYTRGSTTDPVLVDRVCKSIAADESVMVILDSDHNRDHVYAEMQVWAPRVTLGSYMIVEDTNLSGHPIGLPTWDPAIPGPMEAVETFLADRSDFVVDRSCEKFFATCNPSGYLRRVAPGPAGTG